MIEFVEEQDCSDRFDEDVHDLFAGRAADVNNGGPEAQVHCLLDAGYDLPYLVALIDDLI